jgi:hypothetical protein
VSWVARRVVKALPIRTLETESFWVTAIIISPKKLLITTTVTSKLQRIATSKLPLRHLAIGGSQRERRGEQLTLKPNNESVRWP